MRASIFIVSAAEQDTDQSQIAHPTPGTGHACIPWIPVAVAVAGSTRWSFFPGGLHGLLVVLLAAIIVIIWFAIAICRPVISAFHARWRNAGTRFVQLVLAVPLVSIGVFSGDYVHLALAYPFYHQQIGTTPEQPLRFAWGDTSVTALDVATLRTLIYDSRQTTPIVTAEQNALGLKTTQHLVGPFFLEEQTYQ